MTATFRRKLRAYSRPEYAKAATRFFKSGPGQYGEGDCFLGVRVPDIRRIASTAYECSTIDVLSLLHSKWHEERLLALIILVNQFQRGNAETKQIIFNLYLSETRWINNWDLVDVSASQIVGVWLVGRSRGVLRRLAKSKSLWERRIAIIATHAFIHTDDLSDTFAISKLLLCDKHDLIHKACGWMLREAGDRDRDALEVFLGHHLAEMPRTMLRYAIEKFPAPLRRKYLKKNS